METNRRKFLKSFAGGVAGLSVLPVFGGTLKTSLKETNENFLTQSSDKTEDFWYSVKKQFRFAEGVQYFNNA